MTPKSLLRQTRGIEFGRSSATLERPSCGNSSQGVILVPEVENRRVVLCSGKVYYDSVKAREARKDVDLLRLEQLYPFPARALPGAAGQGRQMVWCQEEPRNMGAWRYMKPLGAGPCRAEAQARAMRAREHGGARDRDEQGAQLRRQAIG